MKPAWTFHLFAALLALGTLLGPVAGGSKAQDSAGAKFLRSMDRNGDGILSRAEWTGAGATFVRLDTDRDSYLVKEELDRSMSRPPRKAAPEPVEGADLDAVRVAFLEFPGEAPAFVLDQCTRCHDTERILTARKDAGGWRATVERMAAKEEADLGRGEVERIARYLEGLRAEAAQRAVAFGSADPVLAWAQVLDGAELHRFDRDGDGRLGGGELVKLLVDRVDFDGDGELNQGEFCLLPVGADRAEVFRGMDRNRNGRLSSREMGVPESLLAAADADRDGALSIAEIPRARPGPRRLLLAVDAAVVLELLDRNRDGFVVAKEFKGGEDLLRRFDADRDSKLSGEELTQAITRSRAEGFRVAFDDVLSRFDLDGDGAVSPAEFPGPAVLFRRCDRDGDGTIDAGDTEASLRRPEFGGEAERWRQGR